MAPKGLTVAGAFALEYLVDAVWARLVRGARLERQEYRRFVVGGLRIHHNVVGYLLILAGLFVHPIVLIPLGLGIIVGHRRRDRLFWFIERVIRRGGRTCRFRGLPIGRRRVWIVLRVPRLECKKCGAVRQAEISFAPGQHSYTKRFARYVLELVRHMTMWDVAEHVGVSWNLVKELLKEALRRRFGRPRLKDLRLLFLAIDEISIGRGHRYLTVVLDLESGERAGSC